MKKVVLCSGDGDSPSYMNVGKLVKFSARPKSSSSGRQSKKPNKRERELMAGSPVL